MNIKEKREYDKIMKRNQRQRYTDANLVEKTVRIPNNPEAYNKLLAFEAKLQKKG